MSALPNNYVKSAFSIEGVVVTECRPKQLRSRLKLHFGNRLIFYSLILYRPKCRNVTKFIFASTADRVWSNL